MSKKPDTFLHVQDLERAEQYFMSLGFAVERLDNQSAVLTYADGHAVIASTRQEPLWERLESYAFVPQPGGALTYFAAMAEDIELRLTRLGSGWELQDRLWETNFVVADPDGHRLLFHCSKGLSDENILHLYRKGMTAIRKSLDGLSDEHLDYRPVRQNWSIRQHVHHMTEGDLSSLLRLRMTLAEPGREFPGIVYDADIWMEQLGYATLSLSTLLQLFETIRLYVLELLERADQPFDLGLTTRGQQVKLRDFLRRLATHVLEHVDEIEAIKRETLQKNVFQK